MANGDKLPVVMQRAVGTEGGPAAFNHEHEQYVTDDSVILIDNGATTVVDEALGEGPYIIEFTEDTEGDEITPVENGGTGATTAAQALANLGITAGTEDLNAGVSPLATGGIHLVYE